MRRARSSVLLEVSQADCPAAFLASLLKDIKAERAKVTEKDHLRLLYLTQWFLAFFLALRAADTAREWSFGLVAEVTERSWIVWVLRRMREAVSDKVRPPLPHTHARLMRPSRNCGQSCRRAWSA